MRLILLPLLGLSAFARGGSGRTKAKHCPRKKSATEEYGSGYSLFKEIKCNADGTYEPIQQYADDVRDEGAPEEYVCVSPHSGMVRFELGRNKNSKPCRHEDFNEETLFPNQKSKDDKPCDYAKYRVMVRYEEAEKAGRMISDLSAMQCLDNGLFRPLQYSHMGAYCVASADGAYLGAPSKDDKNEDYCPVGQDKDDNKEDDVYDEGDDYDEDDGEGDDQDDALITAPTGNMPCKAGIDLVIVLDQAENYKGLEEIIKRVVYPKTDVITIVKLENDCKKIQLYGKRLNKQPGQQVFAKLKKLRGQQKGQQIYDFESLKSDCPIRETIFLWNHKERIIYISQGLYHHKCVRCLVTDEDKKTPGHLNIKNIGNFRKVKTYGAAKNIVCKRTWKKNKQ